MIRLFAITLAITGTLWIFIIAFMIMWYFSQYRKKNSPQIFRIDGRQLIASEKEVHEIYKPCAETAEEPEKACAQLVTNLNPIDGIYMTDYSIDNRKFHELFRQLYPNKKIYVYVDHKKHTNTQDYYDGLAIFDKVFIRPNMAYKKQILDITSRIAFVVYKNENYSFVDNDVLFIDHEFGSHEF